MINDTLTGLELAIKDVGWIKQDSNGTYQMTDNIISSKINCSKLIV